MTTIRERLINTLWQGHCLPARGAELLDGYRRVVLAEAVEADPWRRAVEGLNALVDAGIPFGIALDGVIESATGDEAIVWDHHAERWTLTGADDGALAEQRHQLDDPNLEAAWARLAPGHPGRCRAAHPADPSLCSGPAVVTVLDAGNAGADGCEHHAARLLASLKGGRVYGLPDAPEGAAIRVHKAAGGIRPFAWVAEGGWTA